MNWDGIVVCTLQQSEIEYDYLHFKGEASWSDSYSQDMSIPFGSTMWVKENMTF